MGWQQSDLDTVEKALASGQKRVTFEDGRTFEYQAAADMLNVRKEIKAALAAAASQVSPRRVTVGRFRRG
jgi:phage baseplate assembly protein gpV